MDEYGVVVYRVVDKFRGRSWRRRLECLPFCDSGEDDKGLEVYSHIADV